MFKIVATLNQSAAFTELGTTLGDTFWSHPRNCWVECGLQFGKGWHESCSSGA